LEEGMVSERVDLSRTCVMADPFIVPIEHFFCHNSACPDHGKRGHGNVYFRGWSGRHKQIRMVYCRTCKKSYSQRKGTALERSQLPPDKVGTVLDHIREGCGIRATSRLTGVSRDTIARTIAKAGELSKNLHDELVAFSPSNP
jgi:aspartate carbamoyltransferase regulatory subunit